MNARLGIAATVLALSALAGAMALHLDGPAANAAEPQIQGQDTSTLDDQTELALTVYNSDLALVRDVRNLQLPRGTFDLRFMDIAATVNPATVHFRSLTEPSRVDVLEQNYEYDLLEPDKLLRKYVGRDVTLVRLVQDGGDTREEAVKARLLSYNNAPVWQIGNEIVTGMHADHIRFPELPGNLYSRPTLIWSLENDGATRHRVEASYLATKLSWNADYVLTVSRDDKLADVDGWVTLTNGSGTAFRKKQVSMLEATGFPVRKRYVVDGQSFYYRNAQHPGSPIKDVVQVYYQFNNEQSAGLGMPMPAGVVRVYQNDSKGGTHFVGEDRIGHTPKDEMLNLKIGNAFDVVSERKQVDFEKISSNVYEVEYEVVVRNHKATPVTVEVNEPIGGTWRIIRTTHEYTKTDAWAAQFNLQVPADGSTTLKYRVRVTY
jgi:hypothetical protein